MKLQRALFASCLLLTAGPVTADTFTVTSTGSDAATPGTLPWAISQVNSHSAANVFDTIEIQSGLGTLALSDQMFVNANVSIHGNGNTIDMGGFDRAFFLAGGTISISDLSIANGRALGGNGADGGGAGAGLGGAIFVFDKDAAIEDSQNAAPLTEEILGVTMKANVTLTNLSFFNSQAVGGTGGAAGASNGYYGGGGGMGGDGTPAYDGTIAAAGGSGGGFGKDADAGAPDTDFPSPGGPGAFGSAGRAGNGSTDHGGDPGGQGGLRGGGGGGSNAADSGESPGAGGGVGGQSGIFVPFHPLGGGPEAFGGNGGFGGGGAGVQFGNPGAGGFGGGGAGTYGDSGSAAGSIFGGGVAGNSYDYFFSAFGGGNGGFSADSGLYGGGGLGAGGALFVMRGATVNIVDPQFSDNAVSGGAGGGASAGSGSALAPNIFFGADTTITISDAEASVTMLGDPASGDGSDQSVQTNITDPNAQGGLIKQGPGTLILDGTNFYLGATTVNAGTLVLAQTSVITSGGLFTVNTGAALVTHTSNSPQKITAQINEGASAQFLGSGNDYLVDLVSGSLELGGSGNSLILEMHGGTANLGGSGNSLDLTLESGILTVTQPGNGGSDGSNVLVLHGGDLILQAELTVSSMEWVQGATISLALGEEVLLSTASSDFKPQGTDTWNFHFLASSNVEEGASYTLLNSGNGIDGAIQGFSFSSDVPGVDGFFSVSGLELNFTVTAVPEPSSAALLFFGLTAALLLTSHRHAYATSRSAMMNGSPRQKD